MSTEGVVWKNMKAIVQAREQLLLFKPQGLSYCSSQRAIAIVQATGLMFIVKARGILLLSSQRAIFIVQARGLLLLFKPGG